MKNKDITLLRVTHLPGPNVWTYRPVIEAWLDIGAFEQAPSNQLHGFTGRLLAWLPGLRDHRCGVGHAGGFLERLEAGTWIGHVLEHVVLELQSRAGMRTGFGKTRQTAEGSGIYKMAFRTRNEAVGRAALDGGRLLVLAAVEDQPFDVAALIEILTDMVDSLCLGPSTSAITDAAGARRIPFIRLTDGNLVQLGHGVRQRRIWTAETDRTSAIAEYISSDKDLTKRLLASCGVPIPDGQVVASPEEAWQAAQDLGLPVVVKPVDGNHGRGVSLDLHAQDHIEAAFTVARRHGSEVLVERFIPGNEHRLLVVGGQVVAAARGETAAIVGDGQGTILQLVEDQLNQDPRRGHGDDFPLNKIHVDLDSAVRLELSRQGFEPTSVPPAGKRVLIQRTGNVSIDCTDDVHPEVAQRAVLATRIVGLDIAGIDLVVEDISQPLEPQGGAIVEINAGPGLLSHIKPGIGQPRPVGEAIVAHLFPEGDHARIPVVGVAGRHGTTEVARLTAWLLRLAGRQVGLACADGLFLGRRKVGARSAVNFEDGQRLLMNRTVSAAVIETSARAILTEGLPYDRCAVAVITDVTGAEQLAEFYIHDDEQVFDVLRTPVDVVLPDGVAVLNAADAHAVAMAPLCDGGVILYGADETLPAIVDHRAKGGRVVYARGGRLYFATGAQEELLEELGVLAPGGVGVVDSQTVLAVAAAGWALDLDPELIAAGIETFEAEHTTGAPGAPALRQHNA